jgi:hypothetical protein
MGVATELGGLFEEVDLVPPAEEMSGHDAGDAAADDRDVQTMGFLKGLGHADAPKRVGSQVSARLLAGLTD